MKIRLYGGIGLQPGTCGSFGATFQSRNGNERVPVRSARRTATVGIASGTARSKRMPSLARASRFGVCASSSPSYALTKSRRVLSVTIRRTFSGSPSRSTIRWTFGSPSELSLRSHPAAASAAAPAAPAPEKRMRSRRVTPCRPVERKRGHCSDEPPDSSAGGGVGVP